MKHFDPRIPLARGPFLLWGVGLALIKFALDALVAALFHQTYSPLFYLDPSAAPLLHPGAAPPYWATLCVLMVPFAALGITLTARRLRDAGAPQWLTLFFFVPFANLLFFIATALLPSVRRDGVRTVEADSPYRASDAQIPIAGSPRGAPSAVLYSAALGSVVALGGFAVSVGVMGKYGYGLALSTPMISGFIGGIMLPRLLPTAKMRHAVFVCLLTFALSFSLVIAFALEGMGCLVLFVPLLIVPALVGTIIGFTIGRDIPAKEHAIAAGSSVTLLLLTFAVEEWKSDYRYAPAVVETAMEIDAPPEVVWAHTASVETMPDPSEFPFSAGIAYPVRATLNTPAVGGVRTCEFNTGVALETVTAYEENRKLRFDIDSQPAPLRELTLYQTVHQPHLDGAVRNRVGEFELVPLDGGKRTRLVGRSWYELSIAPAFYWVPYSNYVIHAIHKRVLGAIKTRSEGRAKVAFTTP